MEREQDGPIESYKSNKRWIETSPIEMVHEICHDGWWKCCGCCVFWAWGVLCDCSDAAGDDFAGRKCWCRPAVYLFVATPHSRGGRGFQFLVGAFPERFSDTFWKSVESRGVVVVVAIHRRRHLSPMAVDISIIIHNSAVYRSLRSSSTIIAWWVPELTEPVKVGSVA